MSASNNERWWKEAIVYQIYPASFLDTNHDGWGDVPGITSKVDYLKELGVDVVWTSPIYKSPQVDMGYDISDYKDIDPRYGTLADVDHLIAELKKRDMKLMMDLVVNHTSDQHAWFIESRSSLDNPKRDWYIWKKPKIDANGERQPPNNWAMILGEENSVWNYDETTGEYYLGLFTAEQPDLNWENPEVREAVHDILRFWLDRGIAGFRMDVINLISKVQGYPDAEIVAPDHKYQDGHAFFANGPRLHEYLQEMNRKVLSKYDTITVGEMPFVQDHDEILRVVGAQAEELNMIFIFDLVNVDNEEGGFKMAVRKFKPREIGDILSNYQRVMIDRDGWNSVFCENHDQPRSVSRYTDDRTPESRALGSKLLCLMLTTLSGTVYVYQGQEIGMRNVPAEWAPEEYKDIETVNYWKKVQTMYAGQTEKLKQCRHFMQAKARDSARTPMQWTGDAYAGFTSSDGQTPWMRVNDDYTSVNVAAQQASTNSDDKSILHFWQHCLHGRKMHKQVLVYGDFQRVDGGHERLFAYRRTNPGHGGALTVLNFTADEVQWELPAECKIEKWIIGNYPGDADKKPKSGSITLRPWEGLLARCTE